MASKPPIERPQRWVDVETTGLDLDRHEIIEIGITDGEGRVLLDLKVKPQKIEDADPKALEINGYSEAEWEDSIPMAAAAPMILDCLRGAVIMGQNVQFDANRIRKAIVDSMGEEAARKLGYHLVDTATLAWEHLAPYGLPSLSLHHICQFLGISNEGSHRAVADCIRARLVYQRLARASRLQRHWWGWRFRMRRKR